MSRNREDRRRFAEELAAERAKRSPKEQLARLDAMFGKGQGAKKERERLAQQIAAPKKPKEKEAAPAEATAEEPKHKKPQGRQVEKKTAKKVRHLSAKAEAVDG